MLILFFHVLKSDKVIASAVSIWYRFTSFHMQMWTKIKSLVGILKKKISLASTVCFFNETEAKNVTDKLLHIG